MQLYRQACDTTELSAARSLMPFCRAFSLALRMRTPRSTIQLVASSSHPERLEIMRSSTSYYAYSPILQPEGQLYRSRSVGSVRTFRCHLRLARLFLDTLLLHTHKLSQPWPFVSGSSRSTRVSGRLVLCIEQSDDDDGWCM
jgi:hypothetical protein